MSSFEPPQNIQAEGSLLGSILLDNDILDEIEGLEANDFYRRANGEVYLAMRQLHEQGKPVESVGLLNILQKQESHVTASYLAELMGEVSSPSNWASWLEIVKEKATMRKLLMTAHEMTKMVNDPNQESANVIAQAQEALEQVFERAQGPTLRSLADILATDVDSKPRLGVPVGFPSLDSILAGLHPGNLVVLAARPSMGKTALSLNFARNVAKNNQRVGFFSLEMSQDELTERLLAMESGLDSWKLRTGALKDDEFPRLSDAITRLNGLPLYIDDSALISSTDMRSRAKRMGDLDLLIVDYIQLMQGTRKTDSRVQEISDISRALKQLARQLDCPVLALSQLSRAVESRPGNVPQLADLRESGAIEQDADVVMFIYREDYYKKDSDKPNIADILIKKHRNGPTGECELYFDNEKQTFTEVSRDADPG